jgi:hypothetical protein
MGTSSSKETNVFMKLNLPSSSYNSLEEYVQETLSKLENDSLTRLRLDDFSYPDLVLDDLETTTTATGEGESVDGSTLARILQKAKDAPSLTELEFRFLEIDREMTTALLELLQTRIFSQISMVGCSAPQDLFVGLANRLPKRLILNHNHIPYEGYVALGEALADPTKNANLTSLHLKRESLFGENARALFQGLHHHHHHHNTTLTELVLNFCRFHASGVDALCTCLQTNRHIQILDMGACYLGDAHVAQLVQSLRGHPLKQLTLTLNSCHQLGIAAMYELLSSSTTSGSSSQLESLDLSHQKDDHRKLSLGPLVEALRVNRTLKRLQLSRNRLGASEIEPLLEALQENSTLQSLDLNNNIIGNGGAQNIARALPHFRGLEKLFLLNNEIDSNQSSLVLAESMKRNRHIQVLEIQPTLSHVRDIQFYATLNWAGRKRLFIGESHNNNEVPLGLWPIVLERAQNKSKFVPDILYQLLAESNVLRNQ